MPSNTKYNPSNKNQYEKNYLNKDANAVFDTCTAGQTKEIEYTINDDSLLMESCLLIMNATWGDWWKLEIVHPVAGVVFTPVSKWGVDPTNCVQPVPKANFPAKIFTGLKMRLTYTSTGTENVEICMNIDKDKILE